MADGLDPSQQRRQPFRMCEWLRLLSPEWRRSEELGVVYWRPIGDELLGRGYVSAVSPNNRWLIYGTNRPAFEGNKNSLQPKRRSYSFA